MRLLPLILLMVLCTVLALGLFSRHHQAFVSKMIGQKPENISLPLLNGGTATIPLGGKAVLVNVFASWCESCQAEHAVLMSLALQAEIIGIAWKDTPEKIKVWLAAQGNPYHEVLMDERGKATLPLALSGVPETFIFDKHGIIVYNKKAPLTEEEVRTVILPLLEKLHE
jgi:cytochrome c biogenesis protein CcmG/thiol:disulfide interchange protein DsbE